MIIGGQVLIAPAFAFAITYLIDIDTSTASLSIRLDLVPWILSAALAYGIISFILALIAGGFMPISVANSGGWMARLGLIDKFRDPDAIDSARERLRTSPFGRMIRIVHYEVQNERRGLLEVHGGLQMLAAPLQITLVIAPMLAMQYTPENWIAEGHLLEYGLLIYFTGLLIGFRIYPHYAARLVGVASTIRVVMEKVTKLTWTLPVLILWLLVRFVIGVAFNWLGIDMANWQSLAVEKTLIESFLPVEVTVPESSFIDMLVALSVLPIATFTTITVLGGGAIVVPKWMQDPASKLVEMNPTKKEENVEQIQQFSSLQSTSAKRIIEDDGNEPRMEIIESTPTGGISGWVASQVADRFEARSKKKE
ncbi:MAG: hypothetical protein CMA29_00295 [Euryarchaeota archaeon]|nr:hypothetical protein [Euryarchaeota archaeon]